MTIDIEILQFLHYHPLANRTEIIALRHSLLTFKQVGCLCFLFIISLPLYYVYELPYERGIILHHDHYLTIIIQMPISQIWL